jgi:tetratricopeptide (TPR) repeat protein
MLRRRAFAAVPLAIIVAFPIVPMVLSAPALAIDFSTGDSSKQLADAKKRVDAKDFSGAVKLLREVIEAEPRNADAHNYMGYSYRQLGEFERARRHYVMALSIDRNHRGAHEYLGELYLQTGDLEAAQKHLATLKRLCPFGCEEHDELMAAVARYRAKSGS